MKNIKLSILIILSFVFFGCSDSSVFGNGYENDKGAFVTSAVEKPTPTSLTITSSDTLLQDENDENLTHQITADQNISTYSISGGSDSSFFSLSATGLLNFKKSKDFENPEDANTNNEYEVEVEVVSTTNFTARQTIKVSIQNVTEIAVNAVAETITIDEDSITTITTILDNDSGNNIKITAITQPSNTDITLTFDDTSITFTTKNNSVTTQTFSYTISNGEHSSTVTDTINIIDINDAPTGSISDEGIAVDTTRIFDIKTHFSDIDNNNNPNIFGWKTTDFTTFLFSTSKSWISDENKTAGTFKMSPAKANANESVDITVTSTDKGGLYVSDTFTLSVVDSLSISSLNSSKIYIQPSQVVDINITLSKLADIELIANGLTIVLTDGTNDISVSNSVAIAQISTKQITFSYTLPNSFSSTASEEGNLLTIKSITNNGTIEDVTNSSISLDTNYISGTTNIILDTKISDFNSAWEFGDPRYLNRARLNAFVNLKFSEPVWFNTTDYNNTNVTVDNKVEKGSCVDYDTKRYCDEYELDINTTDGIELNKQRIYLGSFEDRSANVFDTNDARTATFVIDTKNPVFTSATAEVTNENTRYALKATATDLNIAAVKNKKTYSMDAHTDFYAISKSSGYLTFNSPMSFEHNTTSYSLEINATDEYNNSTTQTVSLTLINLNETNSTTIKNTNQTTVFKTNDDGTYKKGVAHSYTRDSASNIVTDNVTGLSWQDDDNVKIARDYNDSVDYCQKLTLGGLADWRMPSAKELADITLYGNASAPLMSSVFEKPKKPKNKRYWSSTILLNTPNALFFNFETGTNKQLSIKRNKRSTRCVRGDDRYTHSDFSASSTGEVTDNKRDRVWQDNESNKTNFADAIDYCKDLTLNSNNSWRLPNINELISIVDYSFVKPAIDTNKFTIYEEKKSYWSSTSRTVDTKQKIFIVSFSNGRVNVCGEKGVSKDNNGTITYTKPFVRCVRDK